MTGFAISDISMAGISWSERVTAAVFVFRDHFQLCRTI
jgi:hypothetical protein